MPAMTQERQEPREPAAIHRPASGLSIDPRRLAWWRESRGWSRENLSDAITELQLTDEDGAPLTVTRDAIAKIENGERRPKARTVQALCAALSRVKVAQFDPATGAYAGDVWRAAEEPCSPRDLMPGGAPLAPHLASLARTARLSYNTELRKFARLHGIRYKNPESGRVYYSKPLRDAYELASSGAPAGQVQAMVAQARGEALSVSPDDGIEALDLTVRTHNCLIRAEIRTIGQLTGCHAGQLLGIHDFGSSSLEEVRARLASAGLALDTEANPGNPQDGGSPLLDDEERLAS